MCFSIIFPHEEQLIKVIKNEINIKIIIQNCHQNIFTNFHLQSCCNSCGYKFKYLHYEMINDILYK